MLHRLILPIFVLSALLAACSYFGDGDGMPKTDSLRTELPPADVPTYGKGDRYTYDNPKETWTVVDIANDLVHWKSSLGNSQVTVFDPLMPSIEWTLADKTRATRKILEWNGRMFPLKAGNKLTFKEAFRLGEDTASTRYVWNCYAGQPRQIRVPAGQFATYPVFCERNDGYRAQAYYAPVVNKAVSITYMEPDGRTIVRSLQSFKLGNGQRIAAKPGTSLPRGWSEAAVERLTPHAAKLFKRVPRPLPTIAAAGMGSEPQTIAVTPSAPSTPKTATVSGGRYLVQLSSLSAPLSARKEWTRLQKAFPDLFGERELVLEKRLIAGRGTFYRVQTGRYEALKEARAVCDSLKAKKQDCLVIKR